MALSSSCSYSIGFSFLCWAWGISKTFVASHFGGFNTESRFVAWQKEFVTVRQLHRPLRNVRMDFLVLILRTVNWVFGKFWGFFFFFLGFGLWLLPAAARAWVSTSGGSMLGFFPFSSSGGFLQWAENNFFNLVPAMNIVSSV